MIIIFSRLFSARDRISAFSKMRDRPIVVDPVAARWITPSMCSNIGESQIHANHVIFLIWMDLSRVGGLTWDSTHNIGAHHHYATPGHRVLSFITLTFQKILLSETFYIEVFIMRIVSEHRVKKNLEKARATTEGLRENEKCWGLDAQFNGTFLEAFEDWE